MDKLIRLLCFYIVLLFSDTLLPDDKKEEVRKGILTRPPELLEYKEENLWPEGEPIRSEHVEIPLEIEIDENGNVVEVVNKSNEKESFVKVAIEKARTFKFKPAEIDNKPARVKIIYRFFIYPPEEPQKSLKKILRIGGVVLESGTRTPIGFASVICKNLDDKTTTTTETDEKGRFEFFNLKDGVYKITILAAGYKKFETQELLEKDQELNVKYYVMRTSYNEFETIVRGKKEKKEIVKRTIEREEISKLPGTGGDAIRVIQNMPGVARTILNTGGLIVRGSRPQDTRVFIDGMPLPILFHFYGLTSTYNSEMLSAIDFYPGGFSPEYGNTSAGIVELKRREPKTDRLHGYLDVNIVETSTMVEGPLSSNLSFAAAFRRSYVDFIISKIAENIDEFDMTVAPKYYDYQVQLNYKPGSKDSVDLGIFGSRDAFEMVFKEPIAEVDPLASGLFNAGTMFHTAIAKWIRRGDMTRLESMFGIGYVNFDFGMFERLKISMDRLNFVWREKLERNISERLKLTIGSDIHLVYVGADVLAPQIPKNMVDAFKPLSNSSYTKTDEDEITFIPASFMEFDINLIKKLRLLPGVRVGYMDPTRELTIEPRMRVFYDLTNTLQLKFATGLYRQIPNPSYLSKDYGNPRLHSLYAIQNGLGAEYKFTEDISLDVEAFYKYAWDIAYANPRSSENNIELEPRYLNTGVWRAYGVEVFLRHSPTKVFSGWVSYTLSRSEYYEHEGMSYRISPWDQTHILTLLTLFKLPRNWDIGFRFRLVSGNPTTLLKSGVYMSDYNYYLPIYEGVNNDRMPLFHQLDFRVDKKFIFDKWILSGYIDIQNVYNHRSVEGVIYNYDYTQRQWLEGLPIIPSFGLKAEF
ncbi:MAG: carboxypeptidase regulatory-like domain-containing protein [Deltaproteobacteria bacterium]|nr:carboxypeptidase regulatory-like domain-containing protein [Deltaproteobacteria bacterium]